MTTKNIQQIYKVYINKINNQNNIIIISVTAIIIFNIIKKRMLSKKNCESSSDSVAVVTAYDDDTVNEKNNYLIYPVNYFNVTTGLAPTTEEDAAMFWAYRKNRPKNGVENSLPDGKKMKIEMETLRQDLISFTEASVLEEIRTQAKCYKLTMNST